MGIPAMHHRMKVFLLLGLCVLSLSSAQRGGPCGDGGVTRPTCSGGSSPQCPDGSPLSSSWPPCSGGRPRCPPGERASCSNGNDFNRPRRPCADGSVPSCGGEGASCPDGSAVDYSRWRGGCSGGRPACRNGQTPTCGNGNNARRPYPRRR